MMLPDLVTVLTEGSGPEMRGVLTLYPQALVLVKERTKNKKASENLIELDKWYQEELGPTVLSRTPPHLTLDELIRLMSWKLARGKFRPTLMGLIKNNAEQVVVKATTDGIKLAKEKKLSMAVGALKVLKGVGPATASAILAAAVPEYYCFYADEVADSLPALKSHKYTLRDYEDLNSEMVALADRLNTSDLQDKIKDKHKWTPHMAEQAVWTYNLLYNYSQEVLTSSGVFDERRAKEAKEKEKRREKLANRNGNNKRDAEKNGEDAGERAAASSENNGDSYKNKKRKI